MSKKNVKATEVAAVEAVTTEIAAVEVVEAVEAQEIQEVVEAEAVEAQESQGSDDIEFESVEEIKEMIKALDNVAVYAWAEDLGLEIPEFEHEGIKRMRVAMAIKEFYFPTPKKEKAPTTSPWADYTTAELEKLAKSNKLKFRKVENNDSIKRMWIIKALKDAGVQATK